MTGTLSDKKTHRYDVSELEITALVSVRSSHRQKWQTKHKPLRNRIACTFAARTSTLCSLTFSRSSRGGRCSHGRTCAASGRATGCRSRRSRSSNVKSWEELIAARLFNVRCVGNFIRVDTLLRETLQEVTTEEGIAHACRECKACFVAVALG